MVKELDYCPHCEGELAGDAQKIKPRGLPDIKISEDHWQKIKTALEEDLRHGASVLFFKQANSVKDIKVE